MTQCVAGKHLPLTTRYLSSAPSEANSSPEFSIPKGSMKVLSFNGRFLAHQGTTLGFPMFTLPGGTSLI